MTFGIRMNSGLPRTMEYLIRIKRKFSSSIVHERPEVDKSVGKIKLSLTGRLEHWELTIRSVGSCTLAYVHEHQKYLKPRNLLPSIHEDPESLNVQSWGGFPAVCTETQNICLYRFVLTFLRKIFHCFSPDHLSQTY